MKLAVRGLAPACAWPLLWACDVEVGQPADVLLCDDADAPRAGDPPRVVWTSGPLVASTPAAALVRTPPLATPAPEPEPAADADAATLLAAMRRDYTRQLPTSLAALAQAVTDARHGVASPADARMLAHRLRGTAGSYGHPAVGELAGRFEDRLARGDLSPAPLGQLLAALAELVVAALSPRPLPPGSRIAVVGPAPPGLPDGWLAAQDVAAAARAVTAGEAQAVWVTSEMSRETYEHVLRDIAAESILRDTPVALARIDADPAARVALACLLSGAWGRLALGFGSMQATSPQ